MLISLIAAISRNKVIARQGTMPWQQPADLKYFKQKTVGHHILMGRKTYESLGQHKPLPQRTNIVLTQDALFQAPNCLVVPTLAEALDTAEQNGENELFVIGGGQIYALTLPLSDRLYLTTIETTLPDGDTFFPEIDFNCWQQIACESHPADDRNQYPYTFTIWQRVKNRSY